MSVIKTKSKEKIMQERKRLMKQAMPSVKVLIKKHGRLIVQACLGQIREHEQKAEHLEKLKKQVKKLEKEL